MIVTDWLADDCAVNISCSACPAAAAAAAVWDHLMVSMCSLIVVKM